MLDPYGATTPIFMFLIFDFLIEKTGIWNSFLGLVRFMPAKSPNISDTLAKKITALGNQIKQHRKALGVSATIAAEAATISRVTLYRIKKGEPYVKRQ